MSFVDLAKRAIATGELRRFAHRFGALQLIDESAPAFKAAGLSYMRMDDDEAFDRVLARQSLLRLPLTRAGNRLTVGIDEDAWRSWLSEEPA